jgi:hypothetical protein
MSDCLAGVCGMPRWVPVAFSRSSSAHRDLLKNRLDHVLASFSFRLGFVRQVQSMSQAGRRDRLDILRRNEVVTVQPGASPGGGV